MIYYWLIEATNFFRLSPLFSANKAFPWCLNLDAPQPQPQSFCTNNETQEAVYDLFLFLNMKRICNLLHLGWDKKPFFCTTRVDLSKEETSNLHRQGSGI
jgi:hypothetical protein